MAKNVFNNNKPSSSVSLNGFDGGQFQTYSTKAGLAVPCFYIHTNPKFKCRINVQNFLMAENLRQNAFLRAKQSIDFFFVPYRQLYHKFSEVYYGRGDSQSYVDTLTPAEVPLFRLDWIVNNLFYDYCFAKFYTSIMKVLYNHFISITSSTEEPHPEFSGYSFSQFVFWLYNNMLNLRRQQFGQAMSNFDYSESDAVLKTYTCVHFSEAQVTDYLGQDQDAFWVKFLSDFNYTVEDNIRVLDMLGYGNYFADFDYQFSFIFNRDMHLNFDFYLEDFIRRANPSSDTGFCDTLISCFDTFGDIHFSNHNPFVQQVSCNAFNLMAYQKVFDNVYRNSILSEPLKFGHPLVHSFNVDGIDEDLSTHYDPQVFIALFITPYFIQYRRNITNGLWNSPAFGGNINVPLNSSDPSFSEDDSLAHNGVSIPDLRLGFAMQAFRERLLRCGTREKDLLRGLFGTKSRYISDEYVYYIGSYDGVFNVNTVQDVSGDNLGRLGGNIMSSVTGNQLEFSTEELGVIIGIHSILPTMVYGSFGVDLLNRKSEQFDFYHPDFDNIGLQPVYYSQFNNVPSRQDDKVVGYSARWIEYKQKLDLAHGLFADAVFDGNHEYNDSFDIIKRGADSDYVTNFNNRSIGTLSAQYVSPFSLDNIFDTLTDYSILSDHFKCWLNVKCDMLQPMSVLGLPQLS